jgi:hypothetical protein
MKNVFRAFAIITVIGLTILVSHELVMTDQDSIKTQNPAEKQTYVSEVVLRAPWAEKNLVYDGEESPPGEFGVYQATVPDSLKEQIDAGMPEGPTSFAVAPTGDIYITDPLNYRIQRFTSTGVFHSAIRGIQGQSWDWRGMCTDAQEGVYLLWDQQGELSVRKYSQSGQLLLTYPALGEKALAGAGPYIRCDSEGRLFMGFTYSGEKSYPATFQIGTIDEVFSEAEQKNTLLRKAIKAPSEAMQGGVIGEDRAGNTYTFSLREDGKDWNLFHLTVRKYDKGGGLLTVIQWNHTKGSRWGPFLSENKLVDAAGSFYFYWSTNEGLTITKWHQP